MEIPALSIKVTGPGTAKTFMDFKGTMEQIAKPYNKKYEAEKKFFTKTELQLLVKDSGLYSQTAQAMAHRLHRALKAKINAKKTGKKWGFPRFKSFDRMKSLGYPQSGFYLGDKKLKISPIGEINIKKHREIQGCIKTLTLKKEPSGKWFAIFTSEVEEKERPLKSGERIGLDLGIENFAYLSNGKIIQNPRHLKKAQVKLKQTQRQLSKKQKGSKNRRKARKKLAIAYEKMVNKRRDFLHKITRQLTNSYSLVAIENLNVVGMSKGFLAKEVLDCSFAEFTDLLHYKAEEAGCGVRLVNPANTTSECSNCGIIRKKSLSERWHSCSCGADMHRDLNSAINILNRATSGIEGSQACREETSTGYKSFQQVSSLKQEAKGFSPW